MATLTLKEINEAVERVRAARRDNPVAPWMASAYVRGRVPLPPTMQYYSDLNKIVAAHLEERESEIFAV